MITRNDVINLSHEDSDINEYLMSIYNIPVQMKAKIIVELGAGRSSVALSAAANTTEGDVYSFDLFKDSLLRGASNYKEELLKDQRFHFYEGDCMETVKMWSKPIDFLFYDTSHLYEDTKEQIPVWFRFVKTGGMIFLHDTGHESGSGMGCRKALNEFLETNEGKQYKPIHLMDTKILGATVLIKL